MAFCCDALCPLLAQSGHHAVEFQCLLLGVKQTSGRRTSMSAFDPKRTSGRQACCAAMKALPVCCFHPLRCLVLNQGHGNEATLKNRQQGGQGETPKASVKAPWSTKSRAQ